MSPLDALSAELGADAAIVVDGDGRPVDVVRTGAGWKPNDAQAEAATVAYLGEDWREVSICAEDAAATMESMRSAIEVAVGPEVERLLERVRRLSSACEQAQAQARSAREERDEAGGRVEALRSDLAAERAARTIERDLLRERIALLEAASLDLAGAIVAGCPAASAPPAESSRQGVRP